MKRSDEGWWAMSKNLIITISREYGSGGREIAKNLAQKLGLAYYDTLLIKRLAQESGLCDAAVKSYDEKPVDRFLFSPNRFLSGIEVNSLVELEVHKAEVALLRKIADEGPCVIVGRRADSILDFQPGLVSVFVSAPLPDRVKRVMSRNRIDEASAKMRITETDKARASYHNDFSTKPWGKASTYDLCINSEPLSISSTVDVLASYLQKFLYEYPEVSG